MSSFASLFNPLAEQLKARAANNMVNRLQPPAMQPPQVGIRMPQTGIVQPTDPTQPQLMPPTPMPPQMMPPANGGPGIAPAPGQIQGGPGVQQQTANLQPPNYNNAMLMRLQGMRQPQMMSY